MLFWDLGVRGFVTGRDRFPGLGMFGAGDRGPECLGARISPLRPLPPPVGLGWLTVDGALVRAIFPARWACIAPSFSFSSTSCEDGHKVRPQLGLSLPHPCSGCGAPWEGPTPSLPLCQPPSWVNLAPGTGGTKGSPTIPQPPLSYVTCCSRDCTTSLWRRHCALPFSSRRWSAWQCLGRGKIPRG